MPCSPHSSQRGSTLLWPSVADKLVMPTSEATLRLEGLRKSYGTGTSQETETLHGIDLTLARAESAAMIGPSGSGKST